MATLLFLRKAWEFTKKYAWALFAALSALFAWLLLRKNPSLDDSSVIEQAEKRHVEELEKVKRANEEYVKNLAKNDAELREKLSNIDESYAKQIDDLDAKKKEEAAKIVVNFADDPEALAKALADVFGFSVNVSKK